jgi:hypothetical protein
LIDCDGFIHPVVVSFHYESKNIRTTVVTYGIEVETCLFDQIYFKFGKRMRQTHPNNEHKLTCVSFDS